MDLTIFTVAGTPGPKTIPVNMTTINHFGKDLIIFCHPEPWREASETCSKYGGLLEELPNNGKDIELMKNFTEKLRKAGLTKITVWISCSADDFTHLSNDTTTKTPDASGKSCIKLKFKNSADNISLYCKWFSFNKSFNLMIYVKILYNNETFHFLNMVYIYFNIL